MKTNFTHRQRGPADALAELLREHPKLPEAVWSIDLSGHLHGHMHGPAVEGFEGLTVYVDLMGGSIRPAHAYEMHGATYRVHELHAVWRDVVVLVSVGIAEQAPAVAA